MVGCIAVTTSHCSILFNLVRQVALHLIGTCRVGWNGHPIGCITRFKSIYPTNRFILLMERHTHTHTYIHIYTYIHMMVQASITHSS